jgi:hypothetical protein
MATSSTMVLIVSGPRQQGFLRTFAKWFKNTPLRKRGAKYEEINYKQKLIMQKGWGVDLIRISCPETKLAVEEIIRGLRNASKSLPPEDREKYWLQLPGTCSVSLTEQSQKATVNKIMELNKKNQGDTARFDLVEYAELEATAFGATSNRNSKCLQKKKKKKTRVKATQEAINFPEVNAHFEEVECVF